MPEKHFEKIDPFPCICILGIICSQIYILFKYYILYYLWLMFATISIFVFRVISDKVLLCRPAEVAEHEDGVLVTSTDASAVRVARRGRLRAPRHTSPDLGYWLSKHRRAESVHFSANKLLPRVRLAYEMYVLWWTCCKLMHILKHIFYMFLLEYCQHIAHFEYAFKQQS